MKGVIGILLPGLVPAAAALLAPLFALRDAAPPAAYIAGVAGPLIGADLLHLKEIEQSAVGMASIDRAGTFEVSSCPALSLPIWHDVRRQQAALLFAIEDGWEVGLSGEQA